MSERGGQPPPPVAQPFLVIAYDEEPPLGEIGSRQTSELLPGEIRQPKVQPPTPLLDWGRGESLAWDVHFGGAGLEDHDESVAQPGSSQVAPQMASHSPHQRLDEHRSTPLTGYGRGDNLWGSQEGSGNANGGSHEALHVASASGQLLSAPPAMGAPNAAQNKSSNVVHSHHNNPYGYPSAPSEFTLNRETSSMVFQNSRSPSQILSDALYFQAQMFPPPPPPRVPREARRSRSELWYYYASKWDITHTQPPPPRCPLTMMEEEFTEGLPPMTKVPYRGEEWLERCGFWFAHVQSRFRPPETNAPFICSPPFVIQRAVTD